MDGAACCIIFVLFSGNGKELSIHLKTPSCAAEL